MAKWKGKKSSGSSVDVYEMVTNRIIEALEQGKIPWEKPWVGVDGEAQKNLISKKSYRGINTILLSIYAPDEEWFLTFKQAREKGGQVRAGAKGIPVVYWNFVLVDTDDKDSNGKTIQKRLGFLKYYTVFALKDVDGIERPVTAEKPVTSVIQRCTSAEVLLSQAEVKYIKGDRAYYSPIDDYIGLPEVEQFKSQEHFYGTALHELVHWTGHESRLDRFKGNDALAAFGSESYSKEELVAEIGSAYLSAQLGLVTEDIERNNAAYIQSWLGALRNDKKLVVGAAARAQKAVRFIRGEEGVEDEVA